MQLKCPKCGGAGPFNFVVDVTIARPIIRVLNIREISDAGVVEDEPTFFIDEDPANTEYTYGDDDCPRIECVTVPTESNKPVCGHIWEMSENFGLEFLSPGQVGHPLEANEHA